MQKIVCKTCSCSIVRTHYSVFYSRPAGVPRWKYLKTHILYCEQRDIHITVYHAMKGCQILHVTAGNSVIIKGAKKNKLWLAVRVTGAVVCYVSNLDLLEIWIEILENLNISSKFYSNKSNRLLKSKVCCEFHQAEVSAFIKTR